MRSRGKKEEAKNIAKSFISPEFSPLPIDIFFPFVSYDSIAILLLCYLFLFLNTTHCFLYLIFFATSLRCSTPWEEGRGLQLHITKLSTSKERLRHLLLVWNIPWMQPRETLGDEMQSVEHLSLSFMLILVTQDNTRSTQEQPSFSR